MIKNYFKIALRNLRRHAGYTGINVAGLTVGLACCALTVLYVRHELSYDRFHEEADQVFQVNRSQRGQWYAVVGFGAWADASTEDQRALPRALEALPPVEDAAQFYLAPQPTFVQTGAARFAEEDVLYTNTGRAFLKTFTFDFVEGNAQQALRGPQTALLTERAARRYFGDEAALGQTLRVDTLDLEVTGVVEDWPAASHFDFEVALSVPRIPHWGAYTYVRLAEGADAEAAAALVTKAMNQVNPDRADDPLAGGERLVPLTALHFTQDALYPLTPPGDLRYVYFFALLGALVLLVTCINYMNLSAAMYAARHKEIGVRKVMGAGRSAVARQFLLEAVLLALLCLPLALIAVRLALPPFNRLMGLDLTNGFLHDPLMAVLLLSLTLAAGGLAGSYPALVLSRRPALALFDRARAAGGAGQGRIRARQVLVVTQFSLLIALGSLAFLMNRQLQFVQQKDLGLATDGVVTLRGLGDAEAYRRLKARLEAQPGVRAVGWGGGPGEAYNRATFKAEGTDVVYDDANFRYVSLSWFDVMGIESAAVDRWLGAEGELPETLFFLNETAAQRLGWDNPVGQTVIEDPSSNDGAGYPFTVSGVVPDAHLFSLRESVRPLFIVAYPNANYVYDVVARLDARQDLGAAMEQVEAAWQAVVPGQPFDPAFMTDELAQLYAQDRQAGTLSAYLTALAVLLAMLGLLGLSAYLTGQRRKEIGVRKVLGATVPQILLLLSREFVLLVAVAFGVAVPLAYAAARWWLTGFAYRIEIGPGAFLLVGGGALLAALAAVSYQAVKAATANPTDALRAE